MFLNIGYRKVKDSAWPGVLKVDSKGNVENPIRHAASCWHTAALDGRLCLC